jgi:uncharacterized protein (TIGR01777 family)
MRILVSGATGFIGRAVVLRLQRDGHHVVALVRDPARARGLLGADVGLEPHGAGPAALGAAVGMADAVVNLAGEPIVGGRWTAARKQRLTDSRVLTTRALVEAMAAAPRRPAVFVSASAVGYYGDRGDERLTEASSPGEDFLSTLCVAWEREALRARELGVRVVTPRIGVVLGPGGGALAKLQPLVAAGLGGRLGSGRQYTPWIHLEDLAELFARAVADERFAGALNATAPAPVTNRELTSALARRLHRPAVFAAPAFALRLALGEAAAALLGGQRAEPAALLALGFPFAHPTVEEALADLLAGEGVSFSAAGPAAPAPVAVAGSTYLARRRPRFLLDARDTLAAPQERVFDFFCRAENLGAMTPATMSFLIQKQPETLGAGARIDYRIRVGALPLSWRTSIEVWRAPELFVDAQERGPYAAWWHEHHFRGRGETTEMEDRVYYDVPGGPLAPLVHALFVRRTLEKIFGYRRLAVRLRFGAAG